MLTAYAREQMIEQQVRAWDVLDEGVLDILRKVPREHFVPEPQRFLAFADTEIPIAHGQHMLRPSVVGRLLQALELEGNERVLEIGTGTGYVTACLRAGAAHVRSLEIFPDLADAARTNLSALAVRDVEIVNADAMKLDTSTRFGAIAITASLPVYDERFQRQLEVGGRLFVVIGEPPIMEARVIHRVAEDAWSTESLFETLIDPLVNAKRPPEFTF
jgi:protein-L-isoaspartate(D-aspartate) O-methyltransferase